MEDEVNYDGGDGNITNTAILDEEIRAMVQEVSEDKKNDSLEFNEFLKVNRRKLGKSSSILLLF